MAKLATPPAILDEITAYHALQNEPAWLANKRAAAAARFGELGLPTAKQEAWRFSDVARLVPPHMVPEAAAKSVGADRLTPLFLSVPSHRLVFVNGHFAEALSNLEHLPKGVKLGSIAEAMKGGRVDGLCEPSDETGNQPFTSLNAALFTDGYFVAIEPGVHLEKPIEIIHFADAPTPSAFHVRNLLVAGEGSSATIVETHAGEGAGFFNGVTTVLVEADAAISHVKIQVESEEATHLSLLRGEMGKAGRYEAFVLTLGAGLSRQDLQIASGEGATVGLNGAYLLRGDQEATIAPFVDHKAKGGQTNEVFKGLLQDRAHGVFLGKMAVRPGADQTDAHQLNKTLLLSTEARIDTKPELEIFADEVKCSHGATVGDLDETALFYLQARGIPEADARAMLMEAFILDVVESAGLEQTLTDHVLGQVRAWLGSERRLS